MSGAGLPPRAPSWTAETLALFGKEWRCELRTRTALSTIGLFAFTTLVTVSLTLGPIGATEEMRPAAPVLLWLILLFAAAAGLPRSFVQEEEAGTADTLRLVARPSCLFCGKALYNFTVLLLLEALVTPLFFGILRVPVADPLGFAAALVAGGIGLAVGSTLIAAMVAQARVRGPLFAVLAFPILLPLLKLAVDASLAAASGAGAGAALELAWLYDAMLTIAALMLFPLVWHP
ncbi:MAG: heme exporter protein CcmB [Acidobacteriota bacterium]